MAARKKAAAKKATARVSPSARPDALRRDTVVVPDPLDTSRTLPKRPPEMRDMSPALQREVTKRVGQAGKDAYGRSIRMEDAVRARVDAVHAIAGRAKSGVPKSVWWYPEHQSDILDISEDVGHGPSSTADAAAITSIRNSPENELTATRSAAHIATNPNEVVSVDSSIAADILSAVTPRAAPDAPIPTGNYRLGDLTPKQTAHIAFAGGPRAEVKGANPAPARAARLSPDVTDVTSFSAGRNVAANAILSARGVPLSDVVGPAPKIRSFRRQISLAPDKDLVKRGEGEAAYNAEVFLRMRDQQQMPGQGTFFTASELTKFDPSTADTSTAEDYVMNSMTAHKAVERSQGRKATTDSVAAVSRAASDNVVKKVKKGKQGEGFPVDLDTDEAMHAFNNEATQEAARRIHTTSILPGGEEVIERLTPGGVQPTSWTWHRSQNLKEDKKFNAQAARADALASAKNKLQAAQGFFDFSDIDSPKAVKGTKPRFSAAEERELLESERGTPALHPNDPDSDFYG